MISSLFTLLLLGSHADFCAGYRQGFTAAYCNGHLYFCNSAPVPACPASGPEATWKAGYDRGFDDGEKLNPGH